MPPLRTINDPRSVKAISHPLRVRILARLAERTASPNELAEWLDAPLGTVAYHVRTLRRLGLIELRRETRVRGAVQHHYRALPRPALTDEAWAGASPIAKQALVGSTLQVIDEQARGGGARGGAAAVVRRTGGGRPTRWSPGRRPARSGRRSRAGPTSCSKRSA